MNTKNRTIMIILMAILMIVALIGLRLKNDKSENTNVKATGKTLVVYFSAQNHTKNLAEKIAKKNSSPELLFTPGNLFFTIPSTRKIHK